MDPIIKKPALVNCFLNLVVLIIMIKTKSSILKSAIFIY
ncbi:hypothetical protein CP02DC14_1477, partial [Chlamydia psittaci 02DC14]